MLVQWANPREFTALDTAPKSLGRLNTLTGFGWTIGLLCSALLYLEHCFYVDLFSVETWNTLWLTYWLDLSRLGFSGKRRLTYSGFLFFTTGRSRQSSMPFWNSTEFHWFYMFNSWEFGEIRISEANLRNKYERKLTVRYIPCHFDISNSPKLTILSTPVKIYPWLDYISWFYLCCVQVVLIWCICSVQFEARLELPRTC